MSVSEPPAFLDISCSLNDHFWCETSADERLAQALSQRYDLPELIGRILAARGIGLDQALSFLNPTLKDLCPDPSQFKDMDKAATHVAAQIKQGRKIAVFGDYDVDGATSAALLALFFNASDVSYVIHIPDRQKDGYGPNITAFLELKKRGCDTIICVDCGTSAHQVLAEARDQGLKVIILDHHQPEIALPPALAVINPNRLDEDLSFGNLAAVGVTFLFIIALNRCLKAEGWFEKRPAVNLLQFLDLVALGTVCDVVKLTGLNRALVAQGLKVMASRQNLGLTLLADHCKITESPTTYHLGYLLGPRINAGGRVGDSSLGVDLLSARDESRAQAIAQKLHEHNLARQELEADILKTALAQVATQNNVDSPVIVVSGDEWHQGVIGIIAGRLKELYHRPALAIAFENGIGKGSGRSVSGLNLGQAVIAARQMNLLEAGGGHAMAAGFTVRQDKLIDFQQFLSDHLKAQHQAPLVPMLQIDGALDCGGVTLELIEKLKALEPFGAGNPEPIFILKNVTVKHAMVVGGEHIRCQLTGQTGTIVHSMSFRSIDTKLGRALLQSAGQRLHLCGALRLNHWNGKVSIQFMIKDGAFAHQKSF